MKSIESIPTSCVKFELSQVKNAECVWLDRESSVFSAAESDKKEVQLLKDFSFVNVQSANFQDLETTGVTVLAKGERYGGNGVSKNGGGVRCGNFHGYQVKGVGQNQLVGNHGDKWHSYGGLSYDQGLIELINTRIFRKIMPEGVVDIVGLIYLGENLAYDFPSVYSENPEYTAPAVLLVREQCTRPAHFLPCREFSRDQARKVNIPSDSYRVLMAIRGLQDYYKSIECLIERLGKFLHNSARQFAFARIFRIAHGALTASNVSLDGRWLDLSNIAFLDGGKNYCESQYQLSFFEEEENIKHIVDELLYTFSKYSNAHLNSAPLIHYYEEQLQYYKKYYSLDVMGIAPHGETNYQDKNFDNFFIPFLKILNLDGTLIWKEKSQYTFDDEDPIVVFIEGVFGYYFNDIKKIQAFDALLKKVSGCKVPDVCRSFFALVELSVEDKSEILEKNIILASIRSLRMLYFSSVFYPFGFYRFINETLSSRDRHRVSGFMENIDEMVDWIFEKGSRNKAVIFVNDVYRLFYDAEPNQIVLEINEDEVHVIEKTEHLYEYMDVENLTLFNSYVGGFIVRIISLFINHKIRSVNEKIELSQVNWNE